MKNIAVMVIALGLMGTSAISTAADNSDYRIPVGSRLELLKPLEIPPAFATVRLQFGQIAPRGYAREDFEPACVFESRIVSTTPQRIEPDTFEIVQVRRDYNSSSAEAQSPFRRVGMQLAEASRQYYKTELFLRSGKQPQVLAMTCQHAWEPGSPGIELRPLTIQEIQDAIQGYFKLRLAGEV